MKTQPFIFCFVVLFTSLNSSAQWQKLDAPATYVIDIAGSGNKVCVAYVETSATEILYSADNGDNWTVLNMGAPNSIVKSIEVEGDNIFVGTSSGFYISYDNGSTWNVLDSLGGVSYVDGNKVFLVGPDSIFLSADSGTTWTVVNSGIPNGLAVSSLAVIDNILFAGAETTFLTSGGVLLSADSGFTWIWANNGLFPNVSSLAVIGENLFAGTYGGGGVFASSDTGMNWTPINSGQSWGFIRGLAVNGSNLFAASENDGIFLTKDMGINWTAVNTGLTNTNIHVIAVNDEYIFAKNSDGEIWRRSLSDMISGITDADENKYYEVEIYPNPFNILTTVEFENENKEKHVLTIYNTTGQLVRKIDNIIKGRVKIERKNLNSGLYFFQIMNRTERVGTGKIMIE